MSDGAPARPRLQRALVFLAFAVPAAVLAWLAADSLGSLVAAVGRHAATVDFAPRDAIALPLAVAFAALAVTTLLPAPPPSRRQRAAPPTAGRAATVYMAIAAVAVLATPVTPLLTGLVAGGLLAGYRECPPDPGRRAARRWVRPPAACPRGP